MARPIHSRLKINGVLKTLTPVHVGGYGTSPDTDLPLARNGKDELYIPGTSLAGVLRDWCQRAFGKDFVERVWGFQDGNKGHASFVLVEDVTLPNNVQVEIRDGVGIDRVYGTAAEQVKYDRAVLPRGTALSFAMTVEIASKQKGDKKSKDNRLTRDETDDEFARRVSATKASIGHLFQALQDEAIPLGAARTRGLGRVKLENFTITEQMLDSFDGILSVLNDEGKQLSPAELEDVNSPTPEAQPRLHLTIHWHPRGPLMVKAGYEGIGVDTLPLTSGVDQEHLALVLPGSSVKGALRSHAERIVRTLTTPAEQRNVEDKQNFNKQLEVPLVEELFGARNKKDVDQANGNVKKGLGALAVADCYAVDTLIADDWRKVEIAADRSPEKEDKDKEVSYDERELWRAIKQASSESDFKADTRKFKINHHVASDRWTGGASDGALFSVLAPAPATRWQPLELTLDFNRLPDDLKIPGLMLLLLTLRDLADNCIALGFATNRGMGEVVVTGIEAQGRGLNDACLSKLADFKTAGKFAELSSDLKEKLKTEWSSWCQNNQ